jgi:hypothetical protein
LKKFLLLIFNPETAQGTLSITRSFPSGG